MVLHFFLQYWVYYKKAIVESEKIEIINERYYVTNGQKVKIFTFKDNCFLF